jgi:DNA modification methylase
MHEIELMQGDCLELMKKIPDKSVDMVLCDLPYGATACKWDTVIPFEPLWEQYNRIIKDNGAIVLFGSEPFSTMLRYSNLKMYKYDWVWSKKRGTGFQIVKYKPMVSHENISVFYKKAPTYNPQMRDREKPRLSKNKGTTRQFLCSNGNEYVGKVPLDKKYPITVLEFGNDNQKQKKHPTQKPVALLEYLIKTYTNENETVLDNCAGSMSTVIACLNTKRKCIAMEKDKKYFQIGCNRVKQHILDNRIDLSYNQVYGGSVLWQNLEIELEKDTEDF